MKLKTHKTSSKRIRKTGSGKLQIPTTSAQHLRHNKSKRQKSAAKQYKIMSAVDAKHFAKLVPNL